MKRCSPSLAGTLLGSALLALAACGREEGSEARTLPRERFVEVNVALRTARFPQPPVPATAADSAKARADSARIRAEVLKRHKATAAQLRAFVDALRHETEELAEVWTEIAERVAKADSAARPGSARPDSAAGRPGPPPTPSGPPHGPPRGMPDAGGPPG